MDRAVVVLNVSSRKDGVRKYDVTQLLTRLGIEYMDTYVVDRKFVISFDSHETAVLACTALKGQAVWLGSRVIVDPFIPAEDDNVEYYLNAIYRKKPNRRRIREFRQQHQNESYKQYESGWEIRKSENSSDKRNDENFEFDVDEVGVGSSNAVLSGVFMASDLEDSWIPPESTTDSVNSSSSGTRDLSSSSAVISFHSHSVASPPLKTLGLLKELGLDPDSTSKVIPSSTRTNFISSDPMDPLFDIVSSSSSGNTPLCTNDKNNTNNNSDCSNVDFDLMKSLRLGLMK